MELWQWALVAVGVLITWIPAGGMGYRLCTMVIGPDINKNKNLLLNGWILFVAGALMSSLALVLILFLYIISSFYNLLAGGIPAWWKMSRAFAESVSGLK